MFDGTFDDTFDGTFDGHSTIASATDRKSEGVDQQPGWLNVKSSVAIPR